jgi:hypothetical protein
MRHVVSGEFAMQDMSQEGFTFSVVLTIEDYLRLFGLVSRRAQRGSASRLIYFVVYLCATLISLALGFWGAQTAACDDPSLIGPLCVLTLVLGTIAACAPARLVHARFVRRLSARAFHGGTSHRVNVDPQGVRAEGDHHVSQWRWSGVDEVTVEDGDLMFWLSALGAVRIPQRAFAGAAECDAVLAYARTQMQANK